MIDSDGLLESNYNATDKAGLTVTMGGANSLGRIYFDEFDSSNLVSGTLGGVIHLELPVYRKDRSTFLDPANPNISWVIPLTSLDNIQPPSHIPNFAGIFDQLNFVDALEGFEFGWDTLFTVVDTLLDNTATIAKIP